MFGQHWTMTEADIVKYTFNTTVNAAIKIQGQTPENIEELEIAAFHNGVLRGVASPVVETLTGQYVTYLVVYSSNIGELITFKLYDPSIDKEYDTDYTINFTQTEIGEPIDPVIINFYTKHWNYVYNPEENYMALPCIIKVDGNLIDKSNYEIAAFSGNQLRGVANPELEPVINIYKAMLKIDGTNGETISFRLFDVDAQKELETDYTIPYDFDYFAGDVEIEFKNNPVARIGEEGNAARYFSSLEAAVAAAVDGETIVLLQDVNLTETLTIDKSITIDLNDKNVTLSTGGNKIMSNVTIKNGNLAIADVDTQTTGNSNCFISTNVGASLTFEDIVMTGNGYTTHWAVLCAMSSSTINITNSTVTLSNEKGSKGGFIKDQSGVDNYSQINISNSTLTLTNVSRGFTGAKVTLDKVNLTITGGEHGINGSELVIKNSSNVSISEGTGRAITLNKFDASITGSNVTISNMGEGGIRYKTANTLTVDASSTLSETKAHADVDNAKLNDKVVRGTESQMSTVKVENGVTTVINPVSGQVAYRAYIEDSESREAVKVDLQNVNALNSLAVKLYDANGNLLTTTTYRAGAVEAPEYLTCNIVLSGTASSSWETVISAEKLTVDNYPHKAELVVDGNVINTFENILGNATDAAAYQLPAYKALGCVYKAASITREGKTEYYGTLAAAVNAAQDGDEIVLLDNVTDVDATISKKITLNLNEKIINDAYIIVKSEVNIKNGSIKNVNESYPLVVQDSGKLTVEDVDIEASKSDRAIWLAGSSSVLNFKSGSSILATKGTNNTKSKIYGVWVAQGATANIYGGTITVDAGADATAVAIFGNYENTVNIYGGKISTSGKNYCYAVWVDGDITVTGGEIVTNEKGYGYSSGIRYGNNYALVTATGNVTISGGKITTNSYSGYIVSVGRSYSEQDQTVTITGGEFKNNLSEVEKTTGNHKAPVLVWDGSESATVEATISNGQNGTTPKFEGFNADLYRPGKDDNQVINPNSTLLVSGGIFDVAIEGKYIAPGFKLEQNTDGTYGVVVDPEYGMQAKIVKDGTTTYYTTIADAITAAQPGETVTILDGEYTADITINKVITVVGETDEQGNNLVNITGRVSAYTGATVKNLNVNNTKTGDYDCALNVNGKDIVVDGVNLTGYNAMRYCYASGNITIKNSTIKGSNFAVHFDGSEGGNIVFEDTDITGWASYASTVNNVSYTDCYLDQGSYFGHRYYNKNISFTDCTFKDGLLIDLEASGSNVAFTDADMTVAEVKALFTDPYYVANGNVTLNDVQVTYAASGYTASGSKYFDNLQDAINEVNNGGYITVRSNIELTQGVTVPAGKEITLGLNGYTITGTPTVAAEFAVITNNGNLTIDDTQNGKILCNHNLAPSTGYAVNTITNNGTLTVVAGTIENKSTYPSSNQIGYAIDNNSTTGNAVVTIKGGNVTASGSTYYDGIRQFCNSTTLENSVTIEGGEVSTLWIQNPSNDNEKDDKGSFVITGGTLGNLYLEPSANFSGSISGGHVGSISRHQSGDNDIVSFITGGTFGMDVTEFCAFNYVCTSNGNGTYGIEYKPQEEDAFVISTLHELEAFRDAVNAGNNFSGKVFKLKSNIDLNPTRAINNWEPIGTQANPFKGTFDGGDNTISNLVVEGENNVGLFGYADNATIKNVKLENVNVKGTDCVGAIAGQVYSTSLIDNCHVSGLIQVEGQTNVGGIVGKYYTKVTNSSVIGDGVATSYVKGVHYAADYEGDNIGGIMGHGGENNTFTNNTVKNITISGTRKVGGIVGVTDQNTDVTNCLVENVNIETTATAQYATDNAAKAGHASIVGSYTKLGANNNGTVTNCVVKNVTFVNNDNVTMSAGPITGGAREGMVDPTGVTASGNLVYMSTITGNTTNMYLMNAVAKIDETKYYTLQEAVAASETNETTIDVIANTAETINVQEGANITINNINLTGSVLAPNATLKIVNGSIVNNNSNVSAIEINAGILNLEGVNISSARHAVRIDGDVEAIINGGEYTLNATSGTRHAVNVSGGAEVTIKAGTFEGPAGTTMDSGSAVCVQAGAIVTIEGGDFSKGKNATLGVSGTMIVKGGTFDQDPSAYLADAYTVNIENEMYVVRYTPIMVTYPVGNPVYPEGKVEYYSDMLEAVPYTTNCPRLEGATITLLADVSGAGMRFMENDMVFDLNGHTYTITAGTGSQGTNTSGFQIRPEVTTNVLFKDGTIKVAEGAPVVWMFNCYATDFIVENVTVDCSNMAYSYGEDVYVVVSRSGDNVQLKGQTKIANFDSTVAGYAINVGGTMTIGEEVDLGVNAVIELDGGAQLTAPAGLNVVTVDGYMVVYENGVYKSVKVVAQVGENKFGSVIAALNYAIANNEAQVKIVSDSRELMPTDVYLRLNADLEITAAQPYTVKFYNNGTSYDFVVGSYNSNTLTFGENVTFQLEDRIIWLGYYGNDVDVVVNGTLAASQIWHGADTKVTSTGTIKSTGEAFVMRRGATLTVDGGTVNASYFNILAGNIDAENANITCGAMWIANTGNYIYEGNVNINIKSSTLTSNGNLKSSTAHADGASINFENSEVTFVLFDGYGVSDIDANTKLNVKGTNAAVSIKGLTNNGLVNVTETAKLTLTGTVTNNGAMKLDATSVIYAPENLGVTIDDNDYDVVYENGAYQAVHKPFVAEVDGTQYTSLQAAIDAADGKTVVVLDNITLTETLTVAAGTTVTLDLNGKTISAEATFAVKAIVNNGTLTINGNGGTIDISASTTESIQVVDNYGTLTINGGTYKGATSNFSYAIRANDANSVTNIVDATITTHFGAIGINKGVTTITDGKFEVTSQAGGHALYVANAEVTINGGEFIPYANGYSYAVLTNDANAKVSITGGTFKKGLGDSCVKALSGNIIITGGTFATDVNAYCHEYYDAIQGDDNLWRVEQVLFAQTTSLQGGWNWFSSYVDLSTPDGLEKLQTALVGNGVQIKTQGNQFSFYQNNQWNSSAGFTSLYNEKMYMIQTTNDVNVELIGSVIDYANTVIVLNKGWNWISYPLDVNTEVNEALKNMSPSDGDIIKGYGDNTTSVYYTSDDPATPSAWWPSITLNPGQGYMYKSNTNTSFRYAAGNGTSAKVDSRDNNYWVAAKSQYANNMTIIAMLSIDNEIVKGDYEIAAFANGECRGSARPIYNEYLDAYILLLTVYGDDVEELTFKYYDIDTDTEYELSNVMNYSNDAIVGTLSDPYIFSMNILGIGENSIDNINIYPNPTTTDREINLQAICDKVEVFNALGVKVAEYHNVDTLDAFETAGIYVIRITNDNAVKHCRLVVK